MNKKIDELQKRIKLLEDAVFGSSEHKPIEKKKDNEALIDFSINERAFVKRFVADKSGPKKFVLLLSYLSKGDVNKDIALNDLKDKWSKMEGKALLGGKFNSFYTNEAKNQGWVDSKKRGFFNLTLEWKKVL